MAEPQALGKRPIGALLPVPANPFPACTGSQASREPAAAASPPSREAAAFTAPGLGVGDGSGDRSRSEQARSGGTEAATRGR